MNFKLKLWTLNLLLFIASIFFETKILASNRTVAIEDSCKIGPDSKEIEASRSNCDCCSKITSRRGNC